MSSVSESEQVQSGSEDSVNISEGMISSESEAESSDVPITTSEAKSTEFESESSKEEEAESESLDEILAESSNENEASESSAQEEDSESEEESVADARSVVPELKKEEESEKEVAKSSEDTIESHNEEQESDSSSEDTMEPQKDEEESDSSEKPNSEPTNKSLIESQKEEEESDSSEEESSEKENEDSEESVADAGVADRSVLPESQKEEEESDSASSESNEKEVAKSSEESVDSQKDVSETKNEEESKASSDHEEVAERSAVNEESSPPVIVTRSFLTEEENGAPEPEADKEAQKLDEEPLSDIIQLLKNTEQEPQTKEEPLSDIMQLLKANEPEEKNETPKSEEEPLSDILQLLKMNENNDVPSKLDAEQEENEEESPVPISLGVRQPSFSSLTTGHLITKGGSELPDLNEEHNPVIVDDGAQKSAELPTLSLPKEKEEELMEALRKKQQERWKAMGYDPSQELQRGASQHTFDIPTLQPKQSATYRNSSYANLYSSIQENAKCRNVLFDEDPAFSSYKNLPEIVDEEEEQEEEEEHAEKHCRWVGEPFTPPSCESPAQPDSRMVYTGGQSRQDFDDDDDDHPNFHLDFTEIVDTHGYDSEQGSSRIPPRLYEILVHPKESHVFLALCGVSIVGYKKKVVDDTLYALRDYLQICIKKGYIDESAYVQDIIENTKKERAEMEIIEKMETAEEIEDQLDNARAVHEKKEQQWNNQLSQLETEKDLAMNELEMKYQDERDQLDKLWRSKKMASKFNKPSAKLIEMRGTARRLLTARRFEEAAAISDDIEICEQQEIAEAEKRRKAAYENAISRLQKKFLNDRDTLESTFTMKRNQIERQKESSLLPLSRRVAKFDKKKADLAESQKRNPSQIKTRGIVATPAARTIRPDTTISSKNTKLKLPVLTVAKRSRLGEPTPPASRATSSCAKAKPASNTPSGRYSRLGNLKRL